MPADPTFHPEVYVAALKRERAAVAQGNYEGREAVQTRRLGEIDAEISKHGGEDEAAPKRRERVVNV